MKGRKAIQSEEEALTLAQELANAPKEKANNLPILVAYMKESVGYLQCHILTDLRESWGRKRTHCIPFEACLLHGNAVN